MFSAFCLMLEGFVRQCGSTVLGLRVALNQPFVKFERPQTCEDFALFAIGKRPGGALGAQSHRISRVLAFCVFAAVGMMGHNCTMPRKELPEP